MKTGQFVEMGQLIDRSADTDDPNKIAGLSALRCLIDATESNRMN